MKLTRRIYTTRREKAADFVSGFAGWWFFNMVLFAANGLLLGLVAQLIATFPPETRQNFSILGYILPCGIPLVIDIVVLAFLFSPRRYIVLGALTAFAVCVIFVGLLLTMSFIYFYVFILPKISGS